MTDVRTMFRWVGGAITAVSALFTFAFGLSMSANRYTALVVAVALACAAIGSAFIWPFVADALGKRRWIYASFVALFAVLLTGAKEKNTKDRNAALYSSPRRRDAPQRNTPDHNVAMKLN